MRKLDSHENCHISSSKIAEAHPEYLNDSYIRQNIAVTHIYFDSLHFLQTERDEVYSAIDFIANIGGLLGLCMGVSIISGLELFYFFTARLYYNIVTPRTEDF